MGGHRELLFSLNKKDFVIDDMRAGGPGGQNQNKVSTAIRIRHPASGAAGESRSERSQYINRKLAFEHLVASKRFQAWLKLEIARRLTGKTVEQVVDEQMTPRNIKTDVVDADGRWVPLEEEVASADH